MPAFARSRYAIFLAFAVGGCALDLATKEWIFRELGPPSGHVWWLIDGLFGFQTSVNRGALFGLGQGQVWLFTGLSLLAIVGIVYWLFWVGAARDLWLTIALGSIMAGVLGNLHDRLGLWSMPGDPSFDAHAVRDWILCAYRHLQWPNFNIADSLLVTGIVMILWAAFFGGTETEPAA